MVQINVHWEWSVKGGKEDRNPKRKTGNNQVQTNGSHEIGTERTKEGLDTIEEGGGYPIYRIR